MQKENSPLSFTDPFGEAIQDYLAGNINAEIIVECPLLEDDIIPVTYLFREENELPEIEKIALEHCKGSVLDVGAGAGSHSLILQNKNFEVTALDISELAVDAMKKRGIKNILKADIKTLTAHTYDTLLMLMNGIGLVETLEGLNVFLLNIKHLLNPGGQILLDSTDILYLFEEEDGSVMIDLNANYYGEMRYKMHYKQTIGNEFGWLYLDFSTLQDHAHQAGFNCEKIFENDTNSYLAKLSIL